MFTDIAEHSCGDTVLISCIFEVSDCITDMFGFYHYCMLRINSMHIAKRYIVLIIFFYGTFLQNVQIIR